MLSMVGSISKSTLSNDLSSPMLFKLSKLSIVSTLFVEKDDKSLLPDNDCKEFKDISSLIDPPAVEEFSPSRLIKSLSLKDEWADACSDKFEVDSNERESVSPREEMGGDDWMGMEFNDMESGDMLPLLSVDIKDISLLLLLLLSREVV